MYVNTSVPTRHIVIIIETVTINGAGVSRPDCTIIVILYCLFHAYSMCTLCVTCDTGVFVPSGADGSC